MTIKLEEAKLAGLETVANSADLRQDLHVFVDYIRNHEVKRGYRDNRLPLAHRQRLVKLMSDPATAARSEEPDSSPWITHVDAVCLALGLLHYDTEGSYVGYRSSSASFPDNYIELDGSKYQQFLDLSLQDLEDRLLEVHLRDEGPGTNEFFRRSPLGRLDSFDCWGCATGVVPTIPFPRVRRRLLALLAECPSGVWFTTNSLIEHLRRDAPWFLIPERLPAKLLAGSGRRTRYGNFIERKRGDWGNRDSIPDDDPNGFAKVEGRFVERFLEGIPLLLGYVEVAYRPGELKSAIEPSRGGLPAFRVTERLPVALRRGIASPKVTVLPNFEVHVESLFFPAKIEAQLLSLGELTQRGIVTVFKLAKRKVAAVAASRPEVDVIQDLKALASHDLPANVAQELNEWVGHSDKFILYQGFGVLEGRREQADVNRFLVEPISPTFALVRSPKALYQSLDAAEQVPVRIRHAEHALAAPTGVRSRLAPAVSPARVQTKNPLKLRRTVQTTLWFPDAETHAAFRKILLDAKCVVPMDSRALTVSYPKNAEALVKECLKKLGEQYAVALEDAGA